MARASAIKKNCRSTHGKAPQVKFFYVFRQKIKTALMFYLFGQSCWNCIFKLPRSRAFNDIRLVELWRWKSGSHTFLWWSQVGLLRQRLCRNYRMPSLFCLRYHPGEIAHLDSANRELSNEIQPVEARGRKVALHTSSHLMPTEAEWSAVSTT